MDDREEEIFKRILRQKIREGKKRSEKKQGRKVKTIDIDKAIDRLNKQISKTEIAAGQHVSVATLNRRLKEAGVEIGIKIKAFKKDEKNE